MNPGQMFARVWVVEVSRPIAVAGKNISYVPLPNRDAPAPALRPRKSAPAGGSIEFPYRMAIDFHRYPAAAEQALRTSRRVWDDLLV